MMKKLYKIDENVILQNGIIYDPFENKKYFELLEKSYEDIIFPKLKNLHMMLFLYLLDLMLI